MSTTLLALSKIIARELGYMAGTCSTTGATTTIVDTSADSPFDTGDDSMFTASAWAKIEADSAGTPLNVGEVRRIKASGGYAPGNQTVTTAAAFTNATTATQSYGVYFGVPPTRVGVNKGLDEYINEVLRTRRYRHRSLLTQVTDGDMETSGVTNWTTSNSACSKVTTASSVTAGKQALQVTTSAANGYVQSTAVAVAGTGRSVNVVVDLAANTGSATLQLWDVTNGAEIDSVTTTSRGPSTLWLTDTGVPSTCHSIAVRLIGVGNGDVATWDNLSVRPATDATLTLPSWVTRRSQIERVEYSCDAGYTVATNVLARDSREYADLFGFVVTEDYGASNAFRVTVSAAGANEHVFVVGQRYFAELSADTDTTDADPDWIKAATLTNIYRDKTEATKSQYWAAMESIFDRSPRWSGRAHEAVRA